MISNSRPVKFSSAYPSNPYARNTPRNSTYREKGKADAKAPNEVYHSKNRVSKKPKYPSFFPKDSHSILSIKIIAGRQTPRFLQSRTINLTTHAKIRIGIIPRPKIKPRDITEDEIKAVIRNPDIEFPTVRNGEWNVASAKQFINGKSIIVVHSHDNTKPVKELDNYGNPHRSIITTFEPNNDMKTQMIKLYMQSLHQENMNYLNTMEHIRSPLSLKKETGPYFRDSGDSSDSGYSTGSND